MEVDLCKTGVKAGYAAIKPEFLLVQNTSADAPETESASKEGATKQPSTAEERKQRRGMNKHRAKKNRSHKTLVDNSEHLCPNLIRYGVCNETAESSSIKKDDGDNELTEEVSTGVKRSCRYAHDRTLVWTTGKKRRRVDEPCILYNMKGRCPYSLNCLYAAAHTEVSDLTDKKDEKVMESYARTSAEFEEQNGVEPNVRYMVSRRKYDFAVAKSTVQPSAEERREYLAAREKLVKRMKGASYLAPLTTVGNLPFRRICREFGAEITCSEMVMSTSLLQGRQSEWALLKRHPSEKLFGIQLCCSHADSAALAAQLLTDNCEMDFVDLNLGCPIDLVCQKGGGAALMSRQKKLPTVVESLAAVLSRKNVPLTVKMRTGVETDKPLAASIISKLKLWNVDLCTLHGRSKAQRYTKLADWNYIDECGRAAHENEVTLFGGGDVLSYCDYEKCMAHDGVDGIMLARGAIMKPWIFTEIAERRHWDITAQERLDIFRTYVNYGLEHWGSDTPGVERTRRFLLEWMSFTHRYIPVGLLEVLPQRINAPPPTYKGRTDLETLLSSTSCADWIRVSEMLLGPVPEGHVFIPKHKANSFSA